MPCRIADWGARQHKELQRRVLAAVEDQKREVYGLAMTTTAQLPDWDMTTYFPEIGAPTYESFRSSLTADIQALTDYLQSAPVISAGDEGWWTKALARLEDVSMRSAHLGSYLGCMGAADSRHEGVKRDTAQHAITGANIDKLYVNAKAALGAASGEEVARLVSSSPLKSAAHFLNRLRKAATNAMPAEQESLSADLGVDGISAWGRLYDQISGSLPFDLNVDGHATKALPVSMSRSLLEDANPAVRQATLDGSAQAWEGVGDTVAACLNAISGTRLTLYKRRNIEHFLDPALFDSAISRQTLDCMLDVVRSRQPLPQEYLRHKAKLLGMEKLGFADLMAPIPSAGSVDRVSWEQGRDKVQSAFAGMYPALAALSQKAFDERWIDYQPRPGKRPGGFCSSSQITGQSRIFMTFNGGMGDVQTLAHELGHSFHSYLLRNQRPWAAEYPMTLAETASTFAENLVTHAALGDPRTTRAERLGILDQRMQNACAFMLNIPMRFDFESQVYEQRAHGELSVGAFKELMLAAQRKNYGESLDEARLDPWFWASKLHFYITEISFYNFPYTFGYLFSMGIFARFLEEGASFLPRYEDLLMQTGSAPAEKVAMDALGVDLEKPAFWRASIDLIEADWKSFRELAE